ncbi:uncharacterized protein LOC133192874 [Saccostrea echinata]|uniref:uncharacterized protein LOC133192874 n=1 Tax=Saccostrea echinata TaxID=191078 RepID=UPI002A7F73FB|nr:uncharacterized protein LOC133192874 [Saccostrea echinata]
MNAPSCSSSRDCHCHDGKHPYCSGHTHTCHCYDCTSDSHCQCQAGATGKCSRDHNHHQYCHCQAQSTTSITTTLPLVQLKCSNHKISVIESIAENIHVEDIRASLCPSNNKHQSSEAYVIHKCNSTERTSWMRGLSVYSSCKSILPYTPISTFFDKSTNMAGFFIDCTETGTEFKLKIAAQTCTDAPMILTLDETTTPRVSDFYTINQHL